MANIFQIALAGVGAAPGAFYSEIEEFVGLTDEQTALNVLFDIFNAGADDSEWATALVNNVVGNAVDEASKASLVEEIVSFAAEFGLSRGEIASLLVMIVNSLDPAVEPWGAVKTQWDNRLEVAEALNANLGNMTDANDLAALKELIASVTADPATVEAALEKIESGTIGEVVITYTLEASAPATNEGVANFFTVVASQAVEVDTEVTFLLKIADGDTASLADFNAGAFNAVTVKILAGETVSEAFKVEPITNDGTELTETYTVQATVAGQTLTMQASILDGSVGAGQTFQLTTGLDIIPGMNGSNGNAVTSGNDTVIGVVDTATPANSTLNATDLIDTGEGVDTLKIVASGALTAAQVPSVSNVEIFEVQGSAAITLDTSAQSGLEILNITKAGGAVAATAAATTDVSVAMKAAGATVGVNGGNNVKVALTDVAAAADVVTIGAGTAPKGDVVVEMTGIKTTAGTDATLSNVTVTGGKTISVTQKATSDASAAAADKAGATITQGNITVIGNADTTTVTVKQDATVAETLATDKTGGVTETASVKFGVLKTGDVLAVAGLTLTAAADMTAAEVAAAFANLVNNAAFAAPASILAGDTQSGAAAGKGTYTLVGTAWTSGAASGDTVVFTSTTANAIVGDLTPVLTNTSGNSVAPVVTTTQGKAHDAGASGGVLGVTAGVVDITGGAALANVTVDAYSGASKIQGGGNTALATVNLSNGGNFDIASAAETLALNLTNVIGTVDVQAGTTTLNATVDGNTATTQSTLASATATTVNVSGTGHVAGDTTAGLTAATAINTTGMTAGSATFTIANGTVTTYTGGAAADKVTVSNAGTAISKAIDLGAGDDTLTLVGATVVVPTVTLKGGEGIDTLSIDVASAAVLDNNKDFSAKLDSFERLTLNDAGAGGETIDLANLGFTTYVTTTGSVGLLTLDKMANNGTVVLTAAAITGVTVKVADADTGTADVLNVVVDNVTGTGNVAAGTLTVAEVETVNITVADGDNTGPDSHSLTLTADKATSVVIKNADAGDKTDFTLALTGSTKVTSIDGSAMEGALTVTSLNTTDATTIKGGSGNDVLTAATGTTADVLIGGAGNDILVANAGLTIMTGGEGADVFRIATASLNVNSYSTITDFAAGDLLQIAGIVSFASAKVTLGETAVFQDYANAAINTLGLNAAGWFQFGGNTYVVADMGLEDGATFTNGEDFIVKLTGLVDLSNASFNNTYDTIALV